jgi:hypothetical protein
MFIRGFLNLDQIWHFNGGGQTAKILAHTFTAREGCFHYSFLRSHFNRPLDRLVTATSRERLRFRQMAIPSKGSTTLIDNVQRDMHISFTDRGKVNAG